jgi:hypothetical protein
MTAEKQSVARTNQFVNALLRSMLATSAVVAGHAVLRPSSVEADTPKSTEISCKAGEVITISAQEIEVGGLPISVDPQRNPDKRATVAVACKDDLSFPVKTGPGGWTGRFAASGDPTVFNDDTDTILSVQSSRNDIPGNCKPEGCTGGSREIYLIAYKNRFVHVQYELGADRFRPFSGTQLPLPSYLTFLGEVK